jgi:hypothetical protein
MALIFDYIIRSCSTEILNFGGKSQTDRMIINMRLKFNCTISLASLLFLRAFFEYGCAFKYFIDNKFQYK